MAQEKQLFTFGYTDQGGLIITKLVNGQRVVIALTAAEEKDLFSMMDFRRMDYFDKQKNKGK